MKKNKNTTLPVPKTGSVPIQTDLLKRYMAEVSKLPILSPEEELDLARKMKNENDLAAAKKLVASNLRLVVRIAMDYQNAYHNVMDLIQEGNIGLMKAVSMFDPERGVRLYHYASWWIKSYVLKYIIDNFRLVKLGTTHAQKKLFYQLLREQESLAMKGLPAPTKLLSERLEVSEKDVVEMQQRLNFTDASLDKPISEDSDTHHIDFLKDGADLPDVQLEKLQFDQILDEKFKQFSTKLNPKELSILKERLLSEIPKTLQEIADQYGISKERARQIQENVLKKLKGYLVDHFPDAAS